MIVPYKPSDFNQPLKIKIQRTRYVVMRNNRTEIWCGLAKNFYFKPIQEIGNTSIKTYASEAKHKAVVHLGIRIMKLYLSQKFSNGKQEEDNI